MTLEINYIFLGMMVFIRAGAFFLSVPLYAGVIIPTMLKAALAFITAIIVTPLINHDAIFPSHVLMLVLFGVFEFFVGLVLGMAVRIVFATVDLAGDQIGKEVGLMRASSLNPVNPDIGGGAIGVLFFYLAMLVFLLLNIHHELIYVFIRTFDAVPIGTALFHEYNLKALLKATSRIFIYGFLMGAPFVAVNFLINFTFALLGKVAPKMNVFIVSFAVRILAGLAVMAATVSLMTYYIIRTLRYVPQDMLDFIQF